MKKSVLWAGLLSVFVVLAFALGGCNNETSSGGDSAVVVIADSEVTETAASFELSDGKWASYFQETDVDDGDQSVYVEFTVSDNGQTVSATYAKITSSITLPDGLSDEQKKLYKENINKQGDVKWNGDTATLTVEATTASELEEFNVNDNMREYLSITDDSGAIKTNASKTKYVYTRTENGYSVKISAIKK